MMESLMQMLPQSFMGQTLLVGVAFGVAVYFLTHKRRKLPPGPPGWPLLGNILSMRNRRAHEVFMEWSKVYGPVMTVRLATMTTVILSRIDVVLEALVKRGSDFAGRPYTVTGYTITEGKDIALATYGPTWKLHRKLASKALRQYMMGENLSKRITDSLTIAIRLMKKEKGAFDPYRLIGHMIFNILSGMCFSKISLSQEEDHFKQLFSRIDELNTMVSSGIPEDFIPPLRFLKTPSFRKFKGVADKLKGYIASQVEEHRDTFSPDHIRDFTDAMLAAQNEAKEEEDPEQMAKITNTHVVCTLSDIIFAGIDTSRTTLHWTLLALALNQDIQKKVQEEVDQVIGPDITVDVESREYLPYTEAVLYESMRLRPVAPLGIAHATIRDTTVGGFEIPKGTMVMINYHALHVDPDQWEAVNEFRPERFLDSSGKIGPKPHSWLPFSAGRRVCLGETVAKPELHLLLAGLCRAFHIALEPGVDMDFEAGSKGLNNMPKKYRMVVTPRD